MFYKLILIFFIFSGNFLKMAAAEVPEKIFSDVSSAILENRYDDANNLIDRFSSDNPDEPFGPLMKATVLNYAFIDLEAPSLIEEFKSSLKKTKELVSKRIKQNPDDLWALYYLYSSQALEGSMETANGSFYGGIKKSRSGSLGMINIIERDPEFYDAYLAAGCYRFWKGIVTGPFSKILGGSCQGGIDDVMKAIEKGKLTGDLSKTILIEMLLESDVKEAVTIAEKCRARYPHSRLFAWQLGEGYKKLGRLDDAEKIFTGIASDFDKSTPVGLSGELRCYWKLAELSKSVGKNDICFYYCNKIMNLGKNPEVYKLQKNRIIKAEKMLKDIDK